ncbi:MAG: HDOD domain-containing protein [Gammaproteobacteria bacterium]|nr:HDOD domain-containing protein [Gammaproteobacteria bacterium]
MSSTDIREFLQESGIHAESISHQPALTLEQVAQQLFVPVYQFARATLLRDAQGYLMAVLPVGKSIDFIALKESLSRDLELAWPEECAEVFGDVHTGSIPPIAPLYGIATIIDTSFAKSDKMYIADGSGQCLLQIATVDFLRLQESATVLAFTIDNMLSPSLNRNGQSTDVQKVQSRARRMREKVDSLDNLPPMPDIASQLLDISRDPEAMPIDVAKIVMTDPVISGQIMHYARSPWFAYPGKIGSLNEAIYNVLGMDMALNIALGMASGKVFLGKKEGVLGTQNVWQHSVYCALLAEGLAREMPSKLKVNREAMYLAGLLHNVGYLILNHCFPVEHQELENLILQQPTTPIWQLERKLYGMTHAELGADLMRSWDLPQLVVRCIRHHHDEEYVGQYRYEVLIILLANRLLKSQGIGDEGSDEIPTEILKTLCLDIETVQKLLQNVIDCRGTLDLMVHHMAA